MNNQTKWYDPIMLGAIAGSGMFRILHGLKDVPENQLIVGILGTECNIILEDGNYIAKQGCTLIARSIDDMTEEEVKKTPLWNVIKWDANLSIKTVKSIIKTRYNNRLLSVQDFLYLLSIGVWAGDWHRVVKG